MRDSRAGLEHNSPEKSDKMTGDAVKDLKHLVQKEKADRQHSASGTSLENLNTASLYSAAATATTARRDHGQGHTDQQPREHRITASDSGHARHPSSLHREISGHIRASHPSYTHKALDRYGSYQEHHVGPKPADNYDLTYTSKEHYTMITRKDAQGNTIDTGSYGYKRITDKQGNWKSTFPNGNALYFDESYDKAAGVTTRHMRDGATIKTFDSDKHSEAVRPAEDSRKPGKTRAGRPRPVLRFTRERHEPYETLHAIRRASAVPYLMIPKPVSYRMMSKSEFFEPLGEDLSHGAIWSWWERRRLQYNLMVIGTALASFLTAALCCFLSNVLKPGEDFEEPLGILLFIVVGPIAWNVCYTFGALIQMCVPGVEPEYRRGAGRTF